jgi:hypothetical protein
MEERRPSTIALGEYNLVEEPDRGVVGACRLSFVNELVESWSTSDGLTNLSKVETNLEFAAAWTCIELGHAACFSETLPF